jgi:hypothetical protein
MMKVFLEPGDGNLERNRILFGGVLAGMIAIICALALATRLRKSENGI